MKNFNICVGLFIITSTLSCSNEARTPQSITKALVGIEINKEVRVAEFRDQWGSITGDGISLIVYKAEPNQVAAIKHSCRTKGFKPLPIKESLPDNFINQYVNSTDTIGCYWLFLDKKDSRSYCIVVLNEISNQLIVYNIVY